MSCVLFEREFIEEEIFEELMHCNKDKALGSDDFNIDCIQKFWYVMKEDVLEVLRNCMMRDLLLNL